MLPYSRRAVEGDYDYNKTIPSDATSVGTRPCKVEPSFGYRRLVTVISPLPPCGAVLSLGEAMRDINMTDSGWLATNVLNAAQHDYLSRSESPTGKRARENARRFIFDEDGPWRMAREEWCGVVGRNPLNYQRATLKKAGLIAGGDKYKPRPKTVVILEEVLSVFQEGEILRRSEILARLRDSGSSVTDRALRYVFYGKTPDELRNVGHGRWQKVEVE